MNMDKKILHHELPSNDKLIKSTVAAAFLAALLLVTVVLPSEYGIDPLRVGNLLGLTEMGKIKVQLAEEAALEKQSATKSTKPAATDERLMAVEEKPDDLAVSMAIAKLKNKAKPIAKDDTSIETPSADPSVDSQQSSEWRDQVSITLPPGQGVEIKLIMKQGEKAWFDWTANGGKLNFDVHGDGGGESIVYKKGRGVENDEGIFEAAFNGNHGWFWRNRTNKAVILTLKTKGQYSALKRSA